MGDDNLDMECLTREVAISHLESKGIGSMHGSSSLRCWSPKSKGWMIGQHSRLGARSNLEPSAFRVTNQK